MAPGRRVTWLLGLIAFAEVSLFFFALTPAPYNCIFFFLNGLPLGIQIVGRYREDLRVLRVAKWMEAALGFDPGIPKVMS